MDLDDLCFLKYIQGGVQRKCICILPWTNVEQATTEKGNTFTWAAQDLSITQCTGSTSTSHMGWIQASGITMRNLPSPHSCWAGFKTGYTGSPSAGHLGPWQQLHCCLFPILLPLPHRFPYLVSWVLTDWSILRLNSGQLKGKPDEKAKLVKLAKNHGSGNRQTALFYRTTNTWNYSVVPGMDKAGNVISFIKSLSMMINADALEHLKTLVLWESETLGAQEKYENPEAFLSLK